MTTLDAPVVSASTVVALLADPLIAPLYADGNAILLAAGAPSRLIFASAAAAATFAAGDLDALSRQMFSPEALAGEQLAALACSLAPGGPPRLARLRLPIQRQALTLTLLCRRLGDVNDLPLFLFVVQDSKMGVIRQARAAGDLMMAMHDESLVKAAVPEAEFRAEVQALRERTEPVPAALATASLDELRLDMGRRYGGRGTLRFVWRTDLDMFSYVSPELAEAVGAESAAISGKSLPVLLELLAVEPDALVLAALRDRATWSRVKLLWPIAGTRACLTVELSGTPRFGPARVFDGYGGFGLLHLDQIVAAPPGRAGDLAALMATGASIAPDDMAETPAEPANADAPTIVPGLRDVPANQNVVQLRPAEAARQAAARTAAFRLGETEAAAPDDAARLKLVELRPARLEQGDLAEATVVSRQQADVAGLNFTERQAFRDIARALGVRLQADDEAQGVEAELAGSRAAADPDEPVADAAPARTQEVAAIEDVPSALDEAVLEAPRGCDDAADILDRIPIGVMVMRDGVPLYLNQTLLDLLGSENLDSFREGDGFSRVFGGCDLMRMIGEITSEPISIVTLDGDALRLDAHVEAVDWRGEPAILVSFRRAFDEEIGTRLQSLESELHQSQNEARDLHAMLDTASDGIVVIDAQGAILSLNRAAQTLFGFDPADVAGQNFTFLLAPESQPVARDYLTGLRLEGAPSLDDGREVVGRGHSASALPLFMTLGRLPGSAEPTFCAVLRDQTQRKKVERELQQARLQAERANELKSDFLARVSHEIRTPLNAILGFAEVIVEERFGPIDNERYRDYLKDIHASGSHLMSLVNDLLDLSKIEAGKMELTFADVDANKVVAESIALMQPQASRERVIIRTALASGLPHIVADERSLRQIVLNLLSNAVKFNEPGGQVIVSSALNDAGQAVVRIRDTGIGMTESDVELALEPFRQLPTARKTSGTGLGLPLTKALIEANRASFSIKSRKNEGTLVEIAFPAALVLAAE